MSQQQPVKIDNIVWWLWSDQQGNRHVQPICPIHSLRMYPFKHTYMTYPHQAIRLKCEDCGDQYHNIPRSYSKEEQYVLDRIDSKAFKRMKVLNLDDEAIPIAEDKIEKNTEYFVTSLLTQSKVGLRLIVYAGKKGNSQKTQIFVEPEIKRLAFDQKNLHPTDVFTKLEATFSDGIHNSISKEAKK